MQIIAKQQFLDDGQEALHHNTPDIRLNSTGQIMESHSATVHVYCQPYQIILAI